MGLDITAYRQLRPVEHMPEEDSHEFYELLRVFNIPCYVSRAAPLVEGKFYETDAPMFGFRAGSYSGYNRWRDWLAKLAGYPAVLDVGYRTVPTHAAGAWAAESGPFWELINFADNEGVIGSVVATKLAAEFAEYEERALAASEGEPWWHEQFQKWRRAFEMAADGGAVSFH